ncbi:MAG: NADH-quinone oxidoreductase subunit M [Magnetococcales bacterium]|nr:NADH-quinone oxidoreductase subunit M [Magnetococcales bacterium]
MLYLTLLLAIPLIGSLLISQIAATRILLIRRLALAHASLTLLTAVGLMALFDPGSTSLQLTEYFQWNSRLGTSYSLGIDGFSYPMVVLSALLCFIAVLVSGNITKQVKDYFALLLLLETAILGVFMAQDWALFYLFWELTLIPLFFLIDRWGGANRHGASINFVLYTMGGSVFLLISLLLLYETSPDRSFEMASMAAGARTLDDGKQILIFLGFLIGFGVKIPIFPVHGWLPLAHVEAPSPVSILLSGILLKMGAYGLIRAALTVPAGIAALQPLLATLALIGLIYGGLLAWRQRDMKRMIAYASMSHMGVVLLGIAALNTTGLMGASMQMVSHGLVIASLFLLIGLLYERTKTRDIEQYSSLVRTAPRFTFFTVLAFLAAVGFPGTSGFIAELHILVGGFARWHWAVAPLTLGVLISAAYSIHTVGRLFTGPVRPAMRNVADMRPHEMVAASVLAAGILFFGLFPASLLALFSVSAGLFGAAFQSGF